MEAAVQQNEGADVDDALKSTQPIDDAILKDVIAFVDVRSGNDNRTKSVTLQLEALGATVSKTFTKRVTHVIFNQGSKATFEKAKKLNLPLLSALWIHSCKQNGVKVSENFFPAIVSEAYHSKIVKLRKLRSMNPVDLAEAYARSEIVLKRRIRRQQRKQFEARYAASGGLLQNLTGFKDQYDPDEVFYKIDLPDFKKMPNGLVLYDSSTDSSDEENEKIPSLARRLFNKMPDSPILQEAFAKGLEYRRSKSFSPMVAHKDSASSSAVTAAERREACVFIQPSTSDSCPAPNVPPAPTLEEADWSLKELDKDESTLPSGNCHKESDELFSTTFDSIGGCAISTDQKALDNDEVTLSLGDCHKESDELFSNPFDSIGGCALSTDQKALDNDEANLSLDDCQKESEELFSTPNSSRGCTLPIDQSSDLSAVNPSPESVCLPSMIENFTRPVEGSERKKLSRKTLLTEPSTTPTCSLKSQAPLTTPRRRRTSTNISGQRNTRRSGKLEDDFGSHGVQTINLGDNNGVPAAVNLHSPIQDAPQPMGGSECKKRSRKTMIEQCTTATCSVKSQAPLTTPRRRRTSTNISRSHNTRRSVKLGEDIGSESASSNPVPGFVSVPSGKKNSSPLTGSTARKTLLLEESTGSTQSVEPATTCRDGTPETGFVRLPHDDVQLTDSSGRIKPSHKTLLLEESTKSTQSVEPATTFRDGNPETGFVRLPQDGVQLTGSSDRIKPSQKTLLLEQCNSSTSSGKPMNASGDNCPEAGIICQPLGIDAIQPTEGSYRKKLRRKTLSQSTTPTLSISGSHCFAEDDFFACSGTPGQSPASTISGRRSVSRVAATLCRNRAMAGMWDLQGSPVTSPMHSNHVSPIFGMVEGIVSDTSSEIKRLMTSPLPLLRLVPVKDSWTANSNKVALKVHNHENVNCGSPKVLSPGNAGCISPELHNPLNVRCDTPKVPIPSNDCCDTPKIPLPLNVGYNTPKVSNLFSVCYETPKVSNPLKVDCATPKVLPPIKLSMKRKRSETKPPACEKISSFSGSRDSTLDHFLTKNARKGKQLPSASDATSSDRSQPPVVKTRKSLDDFKMETTKPKRHQSKLKFDKKTALNFATKHIVLTSFTTVEKETLVPIINSLGGARISLKVDGRTSHVVCGDVRRTLNVLLGTVQGCWLLDPQWIYKSLNASSWLDEEEFELSNDFPSARICRLERHLNNGAAYRCQLFVNIEGPIFVHSNTFMPQSELVQLLRLAGAKVTKNIAEAKIVIGSFVRGSDAVCLPEKWVHDSISKFEMLPFEEYFICSLSPAYS